MKYRFDTVVEKIKNNKSVVENYIFMTVLQVLNSLFYLLIYPFLIRTLGAESYGLYVFSLSVVNYFITFVTFGFDLPAAKAIAQNNDNSLVKSNVVSNVFTAKIYLETVAFILFAVLLLTVPIFGNNKFILIILFSQTLTNLFLNQWYFQGIQKMRIVTYIQVLFKIISLPLIFLLISKPSDVYIFALISSFSSVVGAVIAMILMIYKHNIKITLQPISEVRLWIKDGLPFFGTYALTAIKQQSIPIIIGTFFNMKDVAIYDLAYKIFSIPQILFSSINSALFPKIATHTNGDTIRKIFKIETLIGFLIILFVVFFGKLLVILLGGKNMIESYPLSIILSFSILTYFLVSAYINFVFVPQGQYKYVIKNQFVSFFLFFVFVAGGLLFCKSILLIGAAWSVSNLSEILYCKYILKKRRLL